MGVRHGYREVTAVRQLGKLPSHIANGHSHLNIPHPRPGGDDPIAVAIAFVAEQYDGAGKILRLHARDLDAYCSACRVRPVRWPCPAAAIALLALEMTKSTCSETFTIDSPHGHKS